jgi:hypothetical protein
MMNNNYLANLHFHIQTMMLVLRNLFIVAGMMKMGYKLDFKRSTPLHINFTRGCCYKDADALEAWFIPLDKNRSAYAHLIGDAPADGKLNHACVQEYVWHDAIFATGREVQFWWIATEL